MGYNKRYFGAIVIFFCLASFKIFAQNSLQQTVRFIITDKFTKAPLADVNISCVNNASLGGTTNTTGEYDMIVPIGRYTFTYSYTGYNGSASADVIVNSGKQVILNIELEQK